MSFGTILCSTLRGPAHVSHLNFCLIDHSSEQEELEKELNYFVAELPERYWQELDNQEQLDSWLDDSAGKRLDNPFYHIAQAFSRNGDESVKGYDLFTKYQDLAQAKDSPGGDDGEAEDTDHGGDESIQTEASFYERYQNITVNIWLQKGIHHFIQCTQPLTSIPTDLRSVPYLCGTHNDFFPVRRNAPLHDNVKYYVRPMECKLRFTIFKYLEDYGTTDQFWETCVDLDIDPKPQIRLHGAASYFNITNFAQFENIRFTAEDSLAQTSETSDSDSFQSVLKHTPIVKCNFTEEPTAYLRDANVTKANGLLANMNYTCNNTGFNYSLDQPPFEPDQECVDDKTLPKFQGTRECQGEPYHSTFWTSNIQVNWYQEDVSDIADTKTDMTQAVYWKENNLYEDRHNVLFNLYGFDGYRSNRTHAPTLNLIDCDFMYFFNMQALIQVETNNFFEAGVLTGTDKATNPDPAPDPTDDVKFLGIAGEDRGARINITQSTFKHSKFCKGMITYRREPAILFDEHPTFLNISANYERTVNITDNRNSSFVVVDRSSFTNIGYHNVLHAIQRRGGTLSADAINDWFEHDWSIFEDRGMILNLQGFPGAVEISNSTVHQNMVYIKDVLMEPYSLTQKFLDPTQLYLSRFDDRSGVLQFKYCNPTTYKGEYVLQEFIDPDDDFDDGFLFREYETATPIYIHENQGPMIFTNNSFSENIGTMGGAIVISSPNFEIHNRTTLNTTDKPYIIFENNNFTQNMAYFAGNAFYISLVKRAVDDFVDYLQMCGTGILVQENNFYGNIGMKRHNGGAGVIRCHLVGSEETLAGSGYPLQERNATDEELLAEGYGYTDPVDATVKYYDDPFFNYTNVTDLTLNATQQYVRNFSVLEYGTLITKNKFVKNHAGKKGTALLVDSISELQIVDNEFLENGPVTLASEKEFSPYYKYLQNGNRTITLYYKAPIIVQHEQYNLDSYFPTVEQLEWQSEVNMTVEHEIQYFAYFQDEYLRRIDMPQVKGALHIASCVKSARCFWAVEDIFSMTDAEQEQYDNFLQNTSLYYPLYNTTIYDNKFSNNQANIGLQSTQLQEQALSLYLEGGQLNRVYRNRFWGHEMNMTETVNFLAPNIAKFLPDNFFSHAQAPIITIYQDKDETGTYNFIKNHTTILHGNQIFDNKHYQSLIWEHQQYSGSLLLYLSFMSNSTLTLVGNVVQHNYQIGELAALFYLTAGEARIYQNNFKYNGFLTTESFSGNPDSLVMLSDQQTVLPYLRYSFEIAQMHGIFYFSYDLQDLESNSTHFIYNNHFEHNYCSKGCAYYVDGEKHQQFSFYQNVYRFMIASSFGSVFAGSLSVTANTRFSDVWIQLYEEETFENNFGSVIDMTGNNVPVTIVLNSTFINSFSDQGGAIHLQSGGALYCSSCFFSMDEEYSIQDQQTDEQFQQLREKFDWDRNQLNASQANNQTEKAQMSNKTSSLISSYGGFYELESLVSKQVLDSLNLISNMHGQVKIESSENTVAGDKTLVVAKNSTRYRDYLLATFGLEADATAYSAIIDSIFKSCVGSKASAISMQRASLAIATSPGFSLLNFEDNYASEGSTIYALYSELKASNLAMSRNIANQGGCFFLLETQLLAVSNEYQYNYANLGGFMYAIQKSKVTIYQSVIDHNAGMSSAVLYSLANSVEKSILFKETQITHNVANSMTFYLTTTDMMVNSCSFINNRSQVGTHGFELVQSVLVVSQTDIRFSDEYVDAIANKEFRNVDSGFFYLFTSSELHLMNNTSIQNLKAQNQAVLSAFTQSSVFTSNNVTFTNNQAISAQQATTIFLKNINRANFVDAHFENNPQTNIKFAKGDVYMSNCSFTSGSQQHLYGEQANLIATNITIYNSSDSSQLNKGHGIYLTKSSGNSSISNSSFIGLRSFQGAGIFLEDMRGSTVIANNTFLRNSVTSTGGAIKLSNPAGVAIHGNNFTGNFISPYGVIASLYEKTGGGIYYECSPEYEPGCDVSLTSNRFIGNYAEGKGGALRWVNKNFTGSHVIGRALQVGDETNFFLDNEAKYGADQGSYASSLLFARVVEDQEFEVDINQPMTIAPGQDFNLTIIILDQDGKVFEDQNEATAELIFEEDPNRDQLSAILNYQAVADKGIFYFQSLNVFTTPSSQAKVKLVVEGIETYGNTIGFVKESQPIIQFDVRACVKGEQYGINLSCMPCGRQTYLYYEQTQPGNCDECDDNAQCFGKNITAPRQGYWRSNSTSLNYIECFNQKACLGGNETTPIGECAQGYGGIVCADCQGRYSRSGAFICKECPPLYLNIFLTILTFVGLIGTIILLVNSMMQVPFTKKPIYSVYLKILVNHLQLMQVIAKIDFGWPSAIQNLLHLQAALAALPERIISVDCLLIDTVLSLTTPVRLFYVRLISFALLPIGIIIISTVFWALKKVISKYDDIERRDKTYSTIIIMLFLFYPTIVSYMAQSVNCFELEGVFRLYNDLEQVCYQGTHLWIVFLVSYPGLLLWGLGIPLFALQQLIAFVRQMEKSKVYSQSTLYVNMSDPGRKSVIVVRLALHRMVKKI